MTNSKKLICGVAITSLLSASAIGIIATNFNFLPTPLTTLQTEAAQVDSALNQSFFNSVTGKVTNILPVNDSNGKPITGKQLILVENSEGLEANFYISENTYLFNAETVKIGDTVTGFYEAGKPMIMIYPPQYDATILAVNVGDIQLKADIFDKDLLSADKLLKLNLSNDTKIITQSGETYEGKLTSKKLLVVYSFLSKSLPAQTTPEQVIVLNDTLDSNSNVNSMDIVVNNKSICAPAAFRDKNQTVMVPIRAISEALGYKVTWNKSTKTVHLNNTISLTLGKDYYTFAKMAPITLGTAPVALKGKIYVPLDFFIEVVDVNSASIWDNQIIINNK